MLAARYVALNPVRARLVQRPQDWAWSSLRAHLAGCDDGLVTVAPPFDRLGSVTALIDTELIGIEPEAVAPARVRSAETIGRPLGSDDFITRLEDVMRRRLRLQKSERKEGEGDGVRFAGMDGKPVETGNM